MAGDAPPPRVAHRWSDEFFFEPCGRKHFFHLKLRGINPRGGGVIKAGKTMLQEPRWATSVEGALPRGRESPVPVGMMKDALSAQRAEVLEEKMKLESECATLRADLRTHKKNQQRQGRHHEHDLARGSRELSSTAKQIVFVKKGLEAKKKECETMDKELERKTEMVHRRDLKLKQASSTMRSQLRTIASLQSDIDDARQTLAERDQIIKKMQVEHARADQLSEQRFDELRTILDSTREQLDMVRAENITLHEKQICNAATIHRLAGKAGGRPIVNRSHGELDDVNSEAARKCREVMQARVASCIGLHGEEGSIDAASLVSSLRSCGYLEAVWESKQVWELRMAWADELTEMLSMTWGPELTFRFKDQLNLSYDKMDQLRFGLSHHRVAKRLVPRPWFINPWTGAKRNFPQPIAPHSAWSPLVKAFISDHGLTMDSSGTVAQRSISRVVAELVQRDAARGYLAPVAEEPESAAADETVVVLGADGFSAGNMSMMHVGVSIAPSYIAGIAQSNEINLCTVATSRTDDHWGGLDETLMGGYYSGKCKEMSNACIASEFNQMARTGLCEHQPCGGKPAISLPVKPFACFDLAAARGVRGGRGKCACHVAADGSDRLRVPELPEDCTWAEAQQCLDEAFPFLTAAEMRADSHTPPADWDYTAGPWECTRNGCDVSFSTHSEWVASVKALKDMKSNKTEVGKKAVARRATTHAALHPTGQAEHEPPILDMNMDKVIVDPLHCLFLNLPKTLWKYCFGDRMTNSQREVVAEYLSSIGCPLDIRAKGDGRDANRKWFTGAILQRFVEGGRADEGGGLKANIQAIVDIIFKQLPADNTPADVPAADAPATAPPPAADEPANNPRPVAVSSKAPRARSRKRVGGFSAVGLDDFEAFTRPADDGRPADEPSVQPTTDQHAGGATGGGASGEDPATASLRARYASHMDIVKLIFRAWKEFGLLYAEWKREWSKPEDQSEKHARALAMLQHAIAFSRAMADVSYKKHKSWYVFLTTWVVPRQIAAEGDLFPFSTAPIEQRGARMKRIVRSCVSWRRPEPRSSSELPTQKAAKRPYESCAMLQLLRSVVAQEQIWQAPLMAGGGMSVSQRRLLATGRTTIVKKEPQKLLRMVDEVIDLT